MRVVLRLHHTYLLRTRGMATTVDEQKYVLSAVSRASNGVNVSCEPCC